MQKRHVAMQKEIKEKYKKIDKYPNKKKRKRKNI
jgi:hypothetical protein